MGFPFFSSVNAYALEGNVVIREHGRLYPNVDLRPDGELYFNTRYVYAYSEVTPQQMMQGKMVLYGYLLGIKR